MRAYSALPDKTVAAIVAQFSRKNAANLFTGRSGKRHGRHQGAEKQR